MIEQSQCFLPHFLFYFYRYTAFLHCHNVHNKSFNTITSTAHSIIFTHFCFRCSLNFCIILFVCKHFSGDHFSSNGTLPFIGWHYYFTFFFGVPLFVQWNSEKTLIFGQLIGQTCNGKCEEKSTHFLIRSTNL